MAIRSRQAVLKQLVQGVPADVMISSAESSGEDAAELMATINALHLERRLRMLALERSRSHAYWMTGILRRLSRMGNATVDVAEEITSDAFYDKYYAGNRPVVIADAGFPGAWESPWSFDAIKRSFGETIIEVTRWPGWDLPPEASRNHMSTHTLPVAAYVDEIRSDPPGCSYLVSLNGAHRGPLAALAQRLMVLPEVLPEAAKDLDAYIFMGPRGSVTHLHYDPGNTMIVQVLGSKRFSLFAPHDHALLYEDQRKTSKVDVRTPDHERFPLYQFARKYDVTVNAGQALFIPVGWWHFAESLEPSLSISMTVFRHANSYPNDTF